MMDMDGWPLPGPQAGNVAMMDGDGSKFSCPHQIPPPQNSPGVIGRRPNGFLGMSLNDRTILFLMFYFHKTV